jgi:hypothetical protein
MATDTVALQFLERWTLSVGRLPSDGPEGFRGWALDVEMFPAHPDLTSLSHGETISNHAQAAISRHFRSRHYGRRFVRSIPG